MSVKTGPGKIHAVGPERDCYRRREGVTDFEWAAEEDFLGEGMLPGRMNRFARGIWGKGGQTFQVMAPAGAGVRWEGE